MPCGAGVSSICSTQASATPEAGAQSAFSDAVTVAGGAAGRGTVREPDLGQVHEDLPASAR
jgi:hypothetical protein